jgi:hypothetical protein
MKRLLLIWVFSGSLDSFSQDLAPKNLPTLINNKDGTYGYKWPENTVKGPVKPDTIPSSILITHKPPSFGHSIDGYCIYQGNVCTGKHLRYWHKRWIVIGPEYTVWGCKMVNTPKK